MKWVVYTIQKKRTETSFKHLIWTWLKHGVLNWKLLCIIVNSFDFNVLWKIKDSFLLQQQNSLLKHHKTLHIYTAVFSFIWTNPVWTQDGKNSCSSIWIPILIVPWWMSSKSGLLCQLIIQWSSAEVLGRWNVPVLRVTGDIQAVTSASLYISILVEETLHFIWLRSIPDFFMKMLQKAQVNLDC